MSETDHSKNEDLMEGRYRILGTLGEGGVGVVYKAQDTLLDKTVAIKKIQSRSNSTDVIRFQKEAKVGGALVHPNILGVIDFGLTKENDFYLVLNFIEGESLSDLLKRTGPLPIFEALDIFIQIARGLAHAHKNKVIHRDIKPSNIMLVDDGAGGINVLIVDFGLAKSLEQNQSLTKSGVGVGTPRYMSPEQIRADRDTGPATDVYSMGCLMFEVLVGKPPFRGDSVMETLQMHLNDPIPDLNSASDARFSPGIVEIVSKCLQKDASARFDSGQELLSQLDQLLEYLQTSSGEPIDTSKLSSKSDATTSGGSSSRTHGATSLGSEAGASSLTRKAPLVAGIVLASIICLLFAVPIVSSLFGPGMASMGQASFLPAVMYDPDDAQYRGHFDKSAQSVLNQRIPGPEKEIVEIAAAEREFAATSPDAPDAQPIKAKVDSEIEFKDRRSQAIPGIEDPLKAFSSFKRDKENHDRLDAVAPRIADFKALESFVNDSSVKGVRISGCINLAPDVIPYLIPLKLTYLILDDSSLLSPTVAGIPKLTTVSRLVLNKVTIRPRGIAAISQWNNLDKLELHQMNLSDDMLAAVAQLSQLRELFLQSPTFISNQGLASLTKLSLKRLTMNRMQLSDKQMSILKNFRNLESIRLDSTFITSNGLKSLEAMRSLTRVNLSHSPTLLPADVERLKRALPKADVVAKRMQRYDSDPIHEKQDATPHTSVKKIITVSALAPSPDELPDSLAKVTAGEFAYNESNGKYWSVACNDDLLKQFVAKSGRLVHRIQFRNSRVSPAGYLCLKKCPITFLEFENTRITSDVLKAIGNLPELQTIVIKMCPEIDFSYISELNRPKKFHELIIERAKLTKSDIAYIAKIQSVDQLKLDYCSGLTRENLSSLVSLPRLESLHMVATDFSDSGFQVLKKLSLSNLVIANNNITKYGLKSYLLSGSKPISVQLAVNDSISPSDCEKLCQIRPGVQVLPTNTQLEEEIF